MRAQPLSLMALGTLIFVAIACGGDSDDGEAGTAAPVAQTVDLLAGSVPESTLSLKARDIAFDRDELAATAGAVFVIVLKNTGVLLHDFTIDEIPADVSAVEQQRPGRSDVHVALDRDAQERLLLRVTRPGEYTFYCSVPGHRQAGMEGTLLVR